MQKFNKLINLSIVAYILVAVVIFVFTKHYTESEGNEYIVEINRIMASMEDQVCFSTPDFSVYQTIKDVKYLNVSENDNDYIRDFYQGEKEYSYVIKPLITDNTILGYVRFDYLQNNTDIKLVVFVEGILLLVFIVILTLLLYIKYKIVKPFHMLSDMPYELSKGHYREKLEESKNRYFGKFVWGISLLRDHLKYVRNRELGLVREKKMLLRSLSHDIKTPINTIKLYSKALLEGIYEEEELRKEAAIQIGIHAEEIESFVKEIEKSSSEDVLHIEIHISEFYIKELVEKVSSIYGAKCRVIKQEFQIFDYKNKLIKGDFDKSFEAIENIMENAFKYGDGRSIQIRFSEEEHYQLIHIYNSGTVMKEVEMAHLFDSFYRGSNAVDKEGNGLGLYICRQIMKNMEGDIYACAHEDGMEIVLVFPLC